MRRPQFRGFWDRAARQVGWLSIILGLYVAVLLLPIGVALRLGWLLVIPIALLGFWAALGWKKIWLDDEREGS